MDKQYCGNIHLWLGPSTDHYRPRAPYNSALRYVAPSSVSNCESWRWFKRDHISYLPLRIIDIRLQTIVEQIQVYRKSMLKSLHGPRQTLLIVKRLWIFCKTVFGVGDARIVENNLFNSVQLQKEARAWMKSSMWRFTSRSMYPGGQRLPGEHWWSIKVDAH